MKKTPLYENHIQLNGKIVDFGGWALPVEYSGIIPEHEAVRTKAGIFDVSHMGEITVKGQDAEKYLLLAILRVPTRFWYYTQQYRYREKGTPLLTERLISLIHEIRLRDRCLDALDQQLFEEE